MNCPNCKDSRLVPHALETDLNTEECGGCGGHWIGAVHYWRWLDSHGSDLQENPATEHADLEVLDGDSARVCPECKRILARSRVGHGLDFYVDRCIECGGIWLDRNEWLVLKSRNLHDDIHRIFSRSWQDRNLRAEQEAYRERWLKEVFGEERLAYMKEFRAWLRTQEHQGAIHSFLSEKGGGGLEA